MQKILAVQQWLSAFFLENATLLSVLGLLSVIALILLLLAAYYVITRLPVDYFSHTKQRHPMWSEQHYLLRTLLIILKNVAGALLLLLGFILLFMPGQGLLSMFVGVILLDFPRKYELECWMVRKPGIRPAINWMRLRANQPPFSLGQD